MNKASRTIASSDNLGSKPNSKDGNTALQYGFVHNFTECAYVFYTCHAINRPMKSATSNETTRPDREMGACVIPNRNKLFNGHSRL
uniref:Ovule protein n=1 Tax=Panagrellus redivivus TaxID=6233 RepID=A0A7E4ZVS3_PANRE